MRGLYLLALAAVLSAAGCAGIRPQESESAIRYVNLKAVLAVWEGEAGLAENGKPAREEQYRLVAGVIRSAARDRGVSVVLNLDDSVLYADPELDLTA